MTSVSVEEMGNYTDLFKDKMHVVRAFGRQYNRMMLLNNHVQNQFKQKASEIKNTTLQNNKKNLSKNLK